MREVMVTQEGFEPFPLILCELGEMVFLSLRDLVVPATIIGLSNIYVNPAVHKTKGFWGYITKDSQRFDIPTGKTNQDGWDMYHTQNEIPPDSVIVNQFLNIDEPVGHDVQIGDEAFGSLNEALETILPSSKRHLKRRLQKWRRESIEFIASSHGSKEKQKSIDHQNK